jgi:hypothetical protein
VYKGPYWNAGAGFEDIIQRAPGYTRLFGVYYDDPKKVDLAILKFIKSCSTIWLQKIMFYGCCTLEIVLVRSMLKKLGTNRGISNYQGNLLYRNSCIAMAKQLIKYSMYCT